MTRQQHDPLTDPQPGDMVELPDGRCRHVSVRGSTHVTFYIQDKTKWSPANRETLSEWKNAVRNAVYSKVLREAPARR